MMGLMFDRVWQRVVPDASNRGNLREAMLTRSGKHAWPWPGRFRAAVSLSFDDARPSQIDRGVPLLDALGVAVTFFVLPNAAAARRRDWADAVERGHEIGNHTVHHPCSASQNWSQGFALYALSLADIRAELVTASAQLRKLLGIDPWVFAYPCGQTSVGRGLNTQSYVPVVAELFGVGRIFNSPWVNSPARCDLAQVACSCIDGLTFEHLRPLLEETVTQGGWLVLGGHEIGPEAVRETTSIATIEAVVNWCRERSVWIDTIGSIARWIEGARQGDETSRGLRQGAGSG